MSTGTLRDLGETGLIRWIASRRPDRAEGVVLGIGDDAAALAFSPGLTVLAAGDAVVEGVHFRRDWHTPLQVGRKAVAVNLSDMAAMGARGRFLLCQVSFPPDTETTWAKACLEGLIAAALEEGLALVGGDVDAAPGPVSLAVTILGEAPPGRLLKRAGARPGDLLAVTGWPGESAAGFRLLAAGTPPGDRVHDRVIRRHLEPQPRTAFALAAAAAGGVTAAIDLSDGLSTDLGHLVEAGGVGAEVEAASVPLSPPLLAAATTLGSDPLGLALHGGEDYELLLAVDPAGLDQVLLAAREADLPLTVVGRFVPGEPAATIISPDGRRLPLHPGGWEHFT